MPSEILNKKTIQVILTFLCLLILLPHSVMGQEAANNVQIKADEIIFQSDSILIATGHVEIRSNDVFLQSPKLIFDGQSLKVFGPIYATDSDGNIVKSEFAQLTPETRETLFQGVRALFDKQVQIIAESENSTTDGYVIFNNVAVSTCPVCITGETPIWYFKAQSLTTDPEGKRIFLKNAQFRLWGMPLFYYPWMSLANPAHGNAAGFLFPEISYSNDQKLSATIPYFYPLSPSSDVELIFGANTKSRDLEMGYRFRHRFANGWVNLSGGIPVTNQKVISEDFTFTGEWEINPNNRFKFLLTNTSEENTSYPAGLFPDNFSLLFGEYTNTSSRGRTSLRAISIDPLNDQPDVEFRNSLNTLSDFHFASHDLFPMESIFLGYKTAIQVVNTSRETYEFLSSSLLLEARHAKVFDFGLGMTNHLFLLGKEYNVANDRTNKASTNTKAILATDFNYPLISTSSTTTHLLEPFLQGVAVEENNTGDLFLNSKRWRSWQEIDRSSLISPYQISTAPGIGDGNEINIGLKYSAVGPLNVTEVALGRTWKQRRNMDTFDHKIFYDGIDEGLYIAEAKLQFGSKIDAGLLTIRNNNLESLRNEFQFNYSHKEVEVGVGFEKVNLDNDTLGRYLKQERLLGNTQANPPDPRSVKFNTQFPFNEKWVAYSNVNYDQTKTANRTIEFGLMHSYNCLLVTASVNRQLGTITQPQSNTAFKVNVSLNSLTSGAINNCNN